MNDFGASVSGRNKVGVVVLKVKRGKGFNIEVNSPFVILRDQILVPEKKFIVD